ncbi:NUDIX domain-containing protein [Pseudomonadota bacterium]
MKQRLKATPASYLILKQKNEILMHLRQNSGYMDGYYSFVAGHVEPLEGPTGCIIREAKEEAGIKIIKEDLKLVHTMYKPLKGNERIDFFYLCEKWSGDIINCEQEKCGGLDFFSISQLPQNTIPYIKHVIKHVFDKSAHFSEYFIEDANKI